MHSVTTTTTTTTSTTTTTTMTDGFCWRGSFLWWSLCIGSGAPKNIWDCWFEMFYKPDAHPVTNQKCKSRTWDTYIYTDWPVVNTFRDHTVDSTRTFILCITSSLSAATPGEPDPQMRTSWDCWSKILFTNRMPFPSPKQKCQSTEGILTVGGKPVQFIIPSRQYY